MSKPEHSEQNIKKLAEEVTDSCDMDALVQHFYEDQYDYFKNDKEAFLETWNYMEIEDG